jgi:ubiquitin C-terminal hydrolase
VVRNFSLAIKESGELFRFFFFYIDKYIEKRDENRRKESFFELISTESGKREKIPFEHATTMHSNRLSSRTIRPVSIG